MDIWIISAILALTLYLLVTEKIPVDLTALGIPVLLVACRILSPKEAVAGLAHPAVVTVGAMFVVSKGLMRTGAVEFIGRKVVKLSKGNLNLALVIILLTVALASAFINNTPVVILFIPVVMSMCCEFDLSPSQFLIPVSYASILAGTTTLIGTSTNIIISDLSDQYGFGPLGMFELAPIGIPIALLGILYLIFVAPRILPSLLNPTCQLQGSDQIRYLAELKIPRGSDLVGQNPSRVFSKMYPNLEVLELIRYSHIFHPSRDAVDISADDLLLVKASANDLVGILNHEQVQLPRSESGLSFDITKDETIVVELILSPQSALLGQRLLETELMNDPDINVIAIKRSNLHYTERQIHDIRLKTGDIILIWCPLPKLAAMRATREYIIIEDIHEEIVHQRKAWLSGIIFGGMVLTASLGLADIMVCALGAVVLMILSGCLQMRDAYKALQGNVLLLIAGTIALGTAMEKTGASRLYAQTFLELLDGLPPHIILGGIILLTSISTQVLSNNATAVLVCPIAISAAQKLGIDPKSFIVGVCIGASACFATPIGYQTNLLVYGPGGYRFSDFLKLGIPLNLLILILGSYLIPVFWPFH